MKRFLQRVFDKIGRTGFLFLFFLPFGAWGLYTNGWKGLLAAICGWCVGNVIYTRWIAKRFFKDDPRRVR